MKTRIATALALSLAMGGGLAGCNKQDASSSPPDPAAAPKAAGSAEAAVAGAGDPGAAPDEGAAPAADSAAPPVREAAPPAEAETATGDAAEGGAPAAEEERLVVWHPYEGAKARAFEAALAQYDAERAEGELPTLAVAVPYHELADRVGATAAGGRGQSPDVFVFAHNYAGLWTELDIAAGYSQQVPADVLGELAQVALEAATVKGAIRGFPLALEPLALYCNPALVPEPVTSLDALLSRGGELARRAPPAVALAYEATALYFHSPLLHGFGGAVFGGVNRLALDSAEAVAALEYVAAQAGQAGRLASVDHAEAAARLSAGTAACVISGPWLRDELGEGVQYRVQPLPKGPRDAPLKGFMAVELAYVNARSARQAQAFRVAAHLAAAPSARLRAKDGGQIVANRIAWGDEALRDRADLVAFVQAAAASVPIPSDSVMMPVWALYDDALRASLDEGTPAKQALAAAQQGAVQSMLQGGR